MALIHNYGPDRYEGLPDDGPKSEEKLHPLEPDTEEQYEALMGAIPRLDAIRTALFLLKHHLEKLPVELRDEVEGKTGVYRVELEDAVPAVLECRSEFQEAMKAWESR